MILEALGYHAIPVDSPIRRALERLENAEPDVPIASIRSGLEHSIPKNRGAEFSDLMEELAHDTCVENEPHCPDCDLRKLCPTGLERIADAKAAQKAAAKAATLTAKSKTPADEPPAKPTVDRPDVQGRQVRRGMMHPRAKKAR